MDQLTGATRRDVLRWGGLAGIAGAAAAVGLGSGSAGAAVRWPGTAEGLAAIRGYFQARAAAGDATRGSTLTVPMAPLVADFEAERAGFMRNIGSADRWYGSVHGLASDLKRINVLEDTGDQVVVQLYEWTSLNWTPAPREIPAGDLALRQQEPEKFAPRRRDGDPVVSGLGTWHQVVASRYGTGWEISEDRYNEPTLVGKSPSYRPTGLSFSSLDLNADSAALSRRRPRWRPRTQRLMFSATHSYNFWEAVEYSHQYVWNYNPNYVNYNSPCSGGDCANFVSQSFYWGGQIPGNNWYRFWGSTCGQGNRWEGTLNWINNLELRKWARGTGRGVAKSSVTQLGLGDIINYDWYGDPDPYVDHVTIVVDTSPYLVNSHNIDAQNHPWDMGGARDYTFTWMNTTYSA